MRARARSLHRIFEARILNELFNWEYGRNVWEVAALRAHLQDATSIAHGLREQVNHYFTQPEPLADAKRSFSHQNTQPRSGYLFHRAKLSNLHLATFLQLPGRPLLAQL